MPDQGKCTVSIYLIRTTLTSKSIVPSRRGFFRTELRALRPRRTTSLPPPRRNNDDEDAPRTVVGCGSRELSEAP